MAFTVFHHRKSLIFILRLGGKGAFVFQAFSMAFTVFILWLGGGWAFGFQAFSGRTKNTNIYQAWQHFRSGNRTRLPFNPTPRNPDHPMEDKYSYPWNISYPDVLFPRPLPVKLYMYYLYSKNASLNVLVWLINHDYGFFLRTWDVSIFSICFLIYWERWSSISL